MGSGQIFKAGCWVLNTFENLALDSLVPFQKEISLRWRLANQRWKSFCTVISVRRKKPIPGFLCVIKHCHQSLCSSKVCMKYSQINPPSPEKCVSRTTVNPGSVLKLIQSGNAAALEKFPWKRQTHAMAKSSNLSMPLCYIKNTWFIYTMTYR